MGGGQGQSKIGQESDRAIADISMNLYRATKALRAETIGQITEGLKTGTIQDRTGEIQQLVERAMQGGAVSTQALLDAAGSQGQARTPFAQKQVAAARLAGEQQAALAPSDYISAFVRTGEPILVGQAPGLALEGLGGYRERVVVRACPGDHRCGPDDRRYHRGCRAGSRERHHVRCLISTSPTDTEPPGF